MISLKSLIKEINYECTTTRKFLLTEYRKQKKLFWNNKNEFFVKKVNLIGSLAHNTFLPTSDLDINLYVPIGVFCFNKYIWKDYARLIIKKFGDDISPNNFEIHMILRASVLLVTCKTKDGLKLDITVNNNKCMRNAQFYSLFGRISVFSNVSRILKLYSRAKIGRRDSDCQDDKVYPGGFFFEMLTCQMIVRDNNIKIKNAFQRIDINRIKYIIRKNKYTSKKCLKSCVDYIVNLKDINNLVFDYEECLYNHWCFKEKKYLNRFIEEFKKLKPYIVNDNYPTEELCYWRKRLEKSK